MAVVGQIEQHHRQEEPPPLRVRSVRRRRRPGAGGHGAVADGEHFMLSLVLVSEGRMSLSIGTIFWDKLGEYYFLMLRHKLQ